MDRGWATWTDLLTPTTTTNYGQRLLASILARRLSHRVPRGQLLLAAPKDSQSVYHKHNNNKYQHATDLGSLEAVATCQRAKPTSAENEARYLREQTGTSVPGRPGLLVERER